MKTYTNDNVANLRACEASTESIATMTDSNTTKKERCEWCRKSHPRNTIVIFNGVPHSFCSMFCGDRFVSNIATNSHA